MRYQIIILLVAVTLLFNCGKQADDINRVNHGHFKATLTETGELLAVNSRVVVMPMADWSYGRPQIVWLEEEGTLVEKGDKIGLIDTSSVVNALGQERSELEIQQADLQQLIAQQETEMRQLQADLRSRESALRQAEIDVQRVRFESQTKQKINELRLQIAQIEYEKIKKKIEHTRLIHQENLRIQRLNIEQTIAEIEKAKRTIERFTLRAPSDGIVVYMKAHRRSDEKIKVGDTPRPGRPIISLPDVSEMKSLTTVAEKDIFKIQTGQKVIVRLDAFPRIEFPAHIINISNTCREKDNESNTKVFDVEVLLEKSDPILRPGMTTSCDIVVADLDSVNYVSNKMIEEIDNKYYIWVKRGANMEKVPVKLGPRNLNFTVVYGDLQEGERIVNPQRRGDV